MKVLVLSDIHGNYEALEAVLAAASDKGWKEIWFLGDLCGYGPEPEACYRRLLRENTIMIPGNHDLYLCGRMKSDFFSRDSLKSLIISRSHISSGMLNHLKLLSPSLERRGFLLLHGSPEGPSDKYILREEDVQRSFKAASKRWILFGHTHAQRVYTRRWGEISSPALFNGTSLNLRGCRALINPGSVGQPRDNNPEAAWGILNTVKKEFQPFRTAYDIASTQEKMRRMGYSDFLIERLSRGV